ncbi:AraC family transcriptional regulator [uncultured Kordia sp.]|uniref:helix-turn-helix domain-containing protein n=1 Tax=uncultured Kordia sp. TaxID=507699 RepID=UPI00260B122C|nr:AraC family transcriptional regulator [uncultured Kordia sp.]
MKKIVLLVLLFFIGTTVFAQKQEDLQEEFQLLQKQLNDTTITPEQGKTMAADYLKKAQKKGEKRFVGKGYYLVAYRAQVLKNRIAYIDSAITNTESIKGEAEFLMMLYIFRGASQDLKGDYYKALDNYLVADSLAEKHKSGRYIFAAKYNIGFLKRLLGEYEASEKLFNEVLVRLESKEDFNITPYVQTLFQLSSLYYESENNTKCTAINAKGIKLSKEHNLLNFYYHFVVNEGINLSVKGDYSSSIDSIQKGYPHLEEVDKGIANFYLGKSYYAIGKKEKALYYFKKVDTIFRNTNDLLPPLRDAYVYLIDEAKLEQDKEQQLYYTTQMLEVNKVIHSNYKYLSSNIFKKYDTPKYEAERNELIDELKEENLTILQKNKWITISSIIFCVLMLIGFIFNYRLKKKYEQRYNEIMEKPQSSSIEEEIIAQNVIPQAVSLGIDSAIVNEVLQSLDVFEKGEAFLTNQISLKDVAKIVNTNSKYLSKIVNTYKEKNFTTYINDLRIDYLVNHVQTDSKYQKYTIRAIAEEIGFSNPEGFSRAFQKKTGLKPSYFIKKVRENAVKKQ